MLKKKMNLGEKREAIYDDEALDDLGTLQKRRKLDAASANDEEEDEEMDGSSSSSDSESSDSDRENGQKITLSLSSDEED